MNTINNHTELEIHLNESDTAYLLLYKSGSETSECALSNFKNIKEQEGLKILTADVTNVKDIHGKYDISSVPTLLQFKEGRFRNVVKGCQTTEFYQAFINNSSVSSTFVKNDRKTKSIVVYTTPTCTFCTAIKNYLGSVGVSYREIDVSRDQQAAQEMVRRSGQQGVPQTLIDGRLVIGYDKKKIDELLELN